MLASLRIVTVIHNKQGRVDVCFGIVFGFAILSLSSFFFFFKEKKSAVLLCC